MLETARYRLVADVLHSDVDSPVGGELCDSAAHHTRPQNREVLHASGLHGVVVYTGPFARLLTEVEDVDQVLADGRHDEFPGRLRLDLESLREGLVRASSHHLEDLQMGGVMASRPSHDHFLREVVDQPAARRGSVLESLQQGTAHSRGLSWFRCHGLREGGDLLSKEICRYDLVHESHTPGRRRRYLTPAEEQIQGGLESNQSWEPGGSSPRR